jgi:hypothetical protein
VSKGVFVGGIGVLDGGTGVLDGGTGVLDGGTGVLVGGTGVLDGGTGVLDGGTGVLNGGTGVSGCPDCGLTVGVFVLKNILVDVEDLVNRKRGVLVGVVNFVGVEKVVRWEAVAEIVAC